MQEAKALSSVMRVWKFTAGHTSGRGFADDFLKNGRVAIGYIYNKGLSHVKTIHDLPKLRNRQNRQLSDSGQRQMWDFLSMEKGNIVALKLKHEIVAIGIVTTGKLEYDDSPLESPHFRYEYNYPNRKEVFWLTKFKSRPIYEIELAKSFRYPQDTIHEITEPSKSTILAWIISYRDSQATVEEKKLIEQLGAVKTEEEKLPKRILTTPEIAEKEYLAMKKVIEYEETVEHRKVVPVYRLSVGYDLESRSNDDVRYIEVKSRLGSYPVILTETELKSASKFKDNYYLYVLTSNDQILRLQNPSKLKRRRLAHIVWELEDWMTQAEIIRI